MPDIGELFQPLENAIRLNLLPALTGKDGFTNQERAILELPARLGGLGVTNTTKTALLFKPSELNSPNKTTSEAHPATGEGMPSSSES